MSWKFPPDEKPTLDSHGRNEFLWLYDGEEVFRGGYVQYPECEAVDSDAFYTRDGDLRSVIAFMEAHPNSETPPEPPDLG